MATVNHWPTGHAGIEYEADPSNEFSTPDALALKFTKGASWPLVSKSGNYTLTASDVIVLGSATLTLTLPTAVGCTGRLYRLKNTGAGTVTVATTGGQTIDGASTYSLSAANQSVTVVSNGTNWVIV